MNYLLLFEEKTHKIKKYYTMIMETIKCIQEYYLGLKHSIYKNWYKDGTIRTIGIYYMGIRKGYGRGIMNSGKVEFQTNYR